MKKNFNYNGTEYQAYWNEKDYNGKVYFSSTRIGGTYQSKASYSKVREEFVDYRAGELDQAKSAAKALGFVE
jgi:hypothetical protein